jgi:uncharacterized protein (DUF1330 family)
MSIVPRLEKDYPEYFQLYQLCVTSWGNKYLVKEKNYNKYKKEYLNEFAVVVITIIFSIYLFPQ